MSVKEMQQFIGCTGSLNVENLFVDVVIDDVKDGGWGRTLYSVRPVRGGKRTQWVNEDRVAIYAHPNKEVTA